RSSRSIAAVLEGFKAIEARVRVLYGRGEASWPDLGPAISGDFICMIPDDAVAAPEALAEFAARLNRAPETDALYSDEDRIDEDLRRSRPFFKPDWSPEYLESFPYLSSLACYRTAVVRKTGWLDGGGALPDDYDLALRFTELSQQIAHIPKV